MENSTFRKIILVEGCPRSGTKALANLLNSHPEIEISLEKNLTPMLKRNKNKKIKSNYSNKKYIGDKLPEYYYNNKKISKNKEVKIIHISRDPIDVINSMKKESYNKMFRSVNSEWNNFFTLKDNLQRWIYAWNTTLENEKTPDFLHVKYEDFISNIKKSTKEISKFLNIENKFNKKEILEKKPKKHLTKNEKEIINKETQNISKDWNKDLKKIRRKHGKIKLNKTQHLIKKKIKDALHNIK